MVDWRNRVAPVRAVLVIVILAASACQSDDRTFVFADSQTSVSARWAIRQFLRLEAATVAPRPKTNEEGDIAWAESYLLRAYISAYRASGEVRYLDRFEDRARAVADLTDAARGVVDYRGRSLVGWSAKKYSHNRERLVMAVNTGLIVYPYLQFVQLVREDSALQGAYGAAAGEFLSLAQHAMADIDKNYHYDPRTGIGNTTIEYGAPMGGGEPLPNRHVALNSDAAVGRSYLLLWQLTGDADYAARARALALHLQENLQMRDGRYVWRYYCREGHMYVPKWEDIDHGAIEVGFIVAAAQAGIVFDDTDVLRLVGTLRWISRDGGFTEYVTGAGDLSRPVSAPCTRWRASRRVPGDAMSRWLVLGDADRSVVPLIGAYLERRVQGCDTSDVQLMLGLAEYARLTAP